MEKIYKAKIVNNKINFLEICDLSKFNDKVVDIVVKFDKSRTLQQNDYYFGVIIPIIADEMGESTENVHDILKHKFLKRVKNVVGKNGKEEVIEKTISTTKLTTKQFIQYIDSIKIWASEFLGVYIPDPDEIYISNIIIN